MMSYPFINSISENALVEIKTNNPIFGKGSIAISEENNGFTFESNLQAKNVIPRETSRAIINTLFNLRIV